MRQYFYYRLYKNVYQSSDVYHRIVNDYHKMVYEKLAPLMTEEERIWLKEYTRAI